MSQSWKIDGAISGKWLWLALAFVFLVKAEQRWHFPNIYLDSLAQAATFANWESGRGWVAFDEDLGKVASMHRFPPIYPLFIGGINKLVNRWTISMRILDFCSLILLFLGLDKVFRQQLEFKWSMDHAAFLAFALAPFQYATGSGLLAVAIFVWAISELLRFEKQGLNALLNSAILIGVCAWVRPAYLPFVGIIPAYFLWKWRWQKEKIPFKRLVIPLFFLVAFAVGLLYWQSLGPNLVPKEHGFFPENLQGTSPFLIKTMLFWSWPQEIFFENISPIELKVVKGLIGIANLVLLVLLTWDANNTTSKGSKVFWGVALIVIFLNLSFLAYLSLTQLPEYWNEGRPWTYLGEDRYFLPAMLVCLCLMLRLLSNHAWIKWIFRSLTLMYFLAFTYLHIQIHFTSQNDIGFEGSYTSAVESFLIRLRREGTSSVTLKNDPHNYLIEAYRMSPTHGEMSKSFVILPLGKTFPEAKIIDRQGPWV